jgi:hypothetical protein
MFRNFAYYSIQLAAFIEKNRGYFAPLITYETPSLPSNSTDDEVWTCFLKNTRLQGKYGDEIHILAFVLLFNCCIVVNKNYAPSENATSSVFASVVHPPLLFNSEPEQHLGID